MPRAPGWISSLLFGFGVLKVPQLVPPKWAGFDEIGWERSDGGSITKKPCNYRALGAIWERLGSEMEARVGIEPAYTELQSAT